MAKLLEQGSCTKKLCLKPTSQQNSLKVREKLSFFEGAEFIGVRKNMRNILVLCMLYV